MKKILLLAFAIFSINSVFGQAQRTIFVEEFTQASCPPCETTTPALNALMNANIDKVVQLRYQTSWPGVDPMNEDNPNEVRDRVNYYGVSGVPNLLFDGVENSIPASQNDVDNAYARPCPVSMTLEHTLSDDVSKMNVTITVTNEGADAYYMESNRLRVAIMEEDITWSAPPGSTSLTVFEAVMKTFITGTAGMELPEIAAGETWTYTWENESIPGIYDYTKLGVVAFIQNDADRRIAQSSHSKPLELMGDYRDLSIGNTTSGAGSLCDYALTGTAFVSNNDAQDANGYTVEMSVNGEVIQTQSSDDVLSAGGLASVTFDEILLPPGTSVVSYTVIAHDGDTRTIDNFSEAVTIGKAAGVAESIARDFEDEDVSADDPAEGLIVDRPFTRLNFTVVSQDLIGGDDPVGGFGLSDKSISVYLWLWNPNQYDINGSMIIADQYEVPADGISLSFDYAYTSWQGSDDRMIVEVSRDCGETFEAVWDKSGADMLTGAEVNLGNTFWRPGADEWRNEVVDLADFAGETILLRYRVVSAYGDMIYLDNIELKTITDLNELDTNESLNVYPNPASSFVNVELTTANASDVQLRVIDMLGRNVRTERLGTVSGTLNHSLDVSSLANGSYLLLMNVDGREVVKRISVAH